LERKQGEDTRTRSSGNVVAQRSSKWQNRLQRVLFVSGVENIQNHDGQLLDFGCRENFEQGDKRQARGACVAEKQIHLCVGSPQ